MSQLIGQTDSTSSWLPVVDTSRLPFEEITFTSLLKTVEIFVSSILKMSQKF